MMSRRLLFITLIVALLAPAAIGHAQGTDIDPLLDAAIAYLGEQLNTPLTRSDITHWTWEETYWPDTALGCPQAGQTYAQVVTQGYRFMLTYSGTVYEVHLNTDGAAALCASDSIPTPTPLPPEATAPAPDTPGSQLIYTGPDGNIYLTTLDAFPGVAISGDTRDIAPTPAPLPLLDHEYGYYRWSPDGQYLAFIDNALPAHLLLSDGSGAEPVVLASPVASLYPPAWSPDGATLAYVQPTQIFRDNSQVMEIYSLSLPASGLNTPHLIGSFEQVIGCTSGSGDPADMVYRREAGFTGNAFTFLWAESDRLIFTDTCSGVGLAQMTISTGEVITIDPSIARVSFSPDGSHAAGITFANGQPPTLTILNGPGSSETIPLDFIPDQVTWAADDQRLFVSEITRQETFTRPGTGETLSSYTVRLYEVDLASGQTIRRFEQEGRGIGTLIEAPDGSGLLFTLIESARGWLQALNSDTDAAAQRAAAPASWLLLLTPEGQIIRLGRGGQPAFQPLMDRAAG